MSLRTDDVGTGEKCVWSGILAKVVVLSANWPTFGEAANHVWWPELAAPRHAIMKKSFNFFSDKTFGSDLNASILTLFHNITVNPSTTQHAPSRYSKSFSPQHYKPS
jgi:hypothetical protein